MRKPQQTVSIDRSLKSRCATMLPMAENAPSKLREKVFATMGCDTISMTAKNDSLIVELGAHFLTRVDLTSQNYQYVSQKMREAARLLHACRDMNASINTLEDCIQPTLFKDVVKAVKTVAGYDETSGRYKTPSLALKLGHCLKRCASILKSRAIQSPAADADILRKKATDFHELCAIEWAEKVSGAALTTLEQRKWHKPAVLPLSSDVKKVHCLTDKKVTESRATLENAEVADVKKAAYSTMCRGLRCQVVMFNRRRSGEVGRMSTDDFMKRTHQLNDEITAGLSKWEKKLCCSLKPC